MPTTLLTIEEVATKLGVSRQQVKKYIDSGRIKTTRIGARSFVEARHAKKPKPIAPGPKPKR